MSAPCALLALSLFLTACGQKTGSDDSISASGQGKAMTLAPGWVTGTTWPTETVVALNSVAARSTSRVDGSVGVILAGTSTFLSGTTELTLEANAEITGSVRADSIGTVATAHIMGAATYNGLTGTGTIDGTKTAALTVPVPITIVTSSDFTAGTTNLSYTAGSTSTLSAGSYGTVTIAAGTAAAPTILRLSVGIYNFSSITMGDYTRFECDSTSASSCSIKVKNRVRIGNQSYFGPGSANSTNLTMGNMFLFVEGANGTSGPSGIPPAIQVGQYSQLHVLTFAPNGTLQLGASCAGVGKFIAKDVDIGSDTELMTGTTSQRVLVNGFAVGPTWPQELLTALNSIYFLSSTAVTGSAIVIQDGTSNFLSTSEAVMEVSATLTGGLKADKIELKSGARITGNANYNTIVNAGTVGSSTTPLALPVDVSAPAFPVIASGSSSTTIAASTQQTLARGSYRDLVLSAGITTNYTVLTLTGGLYQFRTITLGTYSKLLCAAACEIRVTRNVAAGDFTVIGPNTGLDPSQVKVFVYGLNNNKGNSGPTTTPFAFSTGQNSSATGLFYAPRGTLEGKSGATLSGRFIARDIKLGSSSTGVVAGALELAPAIQTQPIAVTVTQGQPATFTIAATGTDVTLQWKRNNVAISGATLGTYTLPSTLLADSGSLFSVTVTNSLGSVTSSSALLTVNSCDSATYVPSATSCGVGACARTGMLTCVSGSVVNSCAAGTPAASDATCDGIDDNCNGTRDEQYVSVATTCGAGACYATGSTSCVSGAVVNSCTSYVPAANDATCDGRDDNCNGRIDEDWVNVASTCGVGACGRTGIVTCVAGAPSDSCVAGAPTSDANCNGIDEDCDGAADQDYVSLATSCGVGSCTTTGVTNCVGGVVTDSCRPGTNAPTDTTCDGVDDNCNGLIDEGYVNVATSCGVGACAATGTQTCVSGVPQNSCAPGTPAASDTTCNNIDDNCNGTRDEGYVVTATSCGVGACASTGNNTCVSGAVVDTCSPGTPAASDTTCNNIDDNCNGTKDEGYVVTATSCGVGACGRTGTNTCVTGTVVNSCTPGTPAANDSVCNGIDDNCSGQVDEDYVNVATSCGVGGCGRTGTATCVSGNVSNSCVAGTPAANDTSCNGVDDNCNGSTDEGYVSVTTSCGVGACSASGVTSCITGAVQNSCVIGAPAASDPTCNGIDDDCDGTLDENYVSVSTTCGVGACFRSGGTSCVGGNVANSCAPGAPGPSDTTCNGIDENCNGTADEGYPTSGTTCGVGACTASGLLSCSGGTTHNSCVAGTQQPNDTTCNSVDDDCNGQIDEDYVPLVTSCGSGGCATTGMTSCVTGSVHNSCAPSTTDTDGDGLADCTDLCPLDAMNDEDGDSFCANVDNCSTVFNPDQLDTDGDLAGDACDAPVMIEVAGGGSHSCALFQDNLVRCWGDNTYGQLGNGANTTIASLVQVSGLTNAQSIVTGKSHSCARRSTGAVSCWGDNAKGQLGNGSTTASNIPVSVSGVTNAAQIAGGDGHTCARLATGSVVCWGDNQYGQLGIGTLVSSNTAVPVPGIIDAVHLSVGLGHTCAAHASGAISCWGYNGNGQVGNGTLVDAMSPVPVPGITNAQQVAAGVLHTCAKLSTGAVSCWGANWYGQLGNGTTTSSLIPVAVSGPSDVMDIVAGQLHTCALTGAGSVRCWGYGPYGSLGNGSLTDSSTPVAVSGLSNAVQLSAGALHNCAVRATGQVACWGNGEQGQLGQGQLGTSLVPGLVVGVSSATSVATGPYDTCALQSSGSVLCWGVNGAGELGNGTNVDSNTPTIVAGLSNATAIAMGDSHACALRSTGVVSCWGFGAEGQLGDGAATNSNAPVNAAGISTAVAIATGADHSCAVLLGGTVRCWGYGTDGELGDGSTTSASTPVAVSGITDAVSLAAGVAHTCARSSDGRVRCWGLGQHGRLGNGTTNNALTPVLVSGLSDAAAIAAGDAHTCAVRATSEVRCWGDNAGGQVGILGGGPPGTHSVLTPAVVAGLANAQTVGAGSLHTCATLTGGQLRCWGNNGNAQLGNGTLITPPATTLVSNISDATGVSSGVVHSCATSSTGTVSCWGNGDTGRLGNAYPFSSVPVRVIWP